MTIQNQVKSIAQQGRYGDSTLVHMAPSEVAGLAQMGQMTINPQTGLPEAFGLRDAIPIAASIVGGVFGGPVGAGLGSGLATGILEGDLKKGLMAGLTSYGLGAIFQGAGAAAKGAQAATGAVTDAAGAAVQDTVLKQGFEEVTGEALKTAAQDAAAKVIETGGDVAAKTLAEETFKQGAASLTNPAANFASGAKDLFATPFEGGARAGFDAIAAGASQPGAYIPLTIGGGGLAITQAQEAFERDVLARDMAAEEERRMNYLNNPEPILYSAIGGLTGYNEGGEVVRTAPQRKTVPVNPEFMPGINPEALYFDPSTLNVPITEQIATNFNPNDIIDPFQNLGAPTDSAINQGPEVSNRELAMTPQTSLGGFGAPMNTPMPSQTVDPFKAYTGIAPPMLEQVDTAEASYNFTPDISSSVASFANMPVLGSMQFNEGGITDLELMNKVRDYIEGRSEDDSVVAEFIDKYGAEAYSAFRQSVLLENTPSAELVEGKIEGNNLGGQADDVMADMGGETVAVSQGEFIIPADVVSIAGGGDTDSGAAKFYDMMDKIRQKGTGTTKQVNPINFNEVFPV
jgi:hypothetical protein|tara:strand:+ start:7304 stop:9022 length:1719 start_codon:yes stop_codon:yes gene_type:complete